MEEKSSQYGKYFCAFADSNLQISSRRIEQQAKSMNIYDGIYVYDERNLNPDFKQKYKEQLILGSRGYGYWVWKPQVILQVFDLIEEGDVVQYSDVGCHLNPKGRARLVEYFDLTKHSKSGVLGFRNKTIDELSPGETLYDYHDLNYTKMDLIQYFHLENNLDLLQLPQFGGTIGFFRKDAQTIQFLRDWANIYATDFSLADDTPSVAPNHPEFIEHRHDQSIFSLLCKTRGAEELFVTEFYTQGDWNELAAFPIWAKRDKIIPWDKKQLLKIKKIANKIASFFKAS